MLWLKKFPWLSLVLLVITYSTFGWYISQSSQIWSHLLAEQGESWGWGLKDELYIFLLYGLSAIVILLVTFGLTAPVAILTFFMGSPLKSDVTAMFAVLTWSFAVVLIFCWLEYFVRLLVLVCAAILARLGLEESGCSNWQTYAILGFMSIGSFSLGILLFLEFGRGIEVSF